MVYQIDSDHQRLLWIGWDRTEATLRGVFAWLDESRSAALRYVCSDMWKPYLSVIRDQAAGVLNMLDRFHILSNMNKALEEVRRQEARRLKAAGKRPVLKHARWWILIQVANQWRVVHFETVGLGHGLAEGQAVECVATACRFASDRNTLKVNHDQTVIGS